MSISHSNSQPQEGRITVGKVLGAHGIKGNLRIHPLTDYPDRFLDMETLFVEKKGKPPKTLEIESVIPHEGKGQFLVKVLGIDDRDAAEAVSGYLVTVSPDERVTLSEGEFWIDSLIGLGVYETNDDCSAGMQLEKFDEKSRLGIIEDVFSTGSNDVYMVRALDGKLKPIPAVADVVRNIDIEAGVMTVILPEGLWD